MPNIILMQVESNNGEKFIVGGYSSHGWLRETAH